MPKNELVKGIDLQVSQATFNAAGTTLGAASGMEVHDYVGVWHTGTVPWASINALGGSFVLEQTLKAWTESAAYELTAITYDADNVPTTATVRWPDTSAGTFTTTNKNNTWLSVDAYTISHTVSGKTVTQTVITRDSNGNITAKPALTVA